MTKRNLNDLKQTIICFNVCALNNVSARAGIFFCYSQFLVVVIIHSNVLTILNWLQDEVLFEWYIYFVKVCSGLMYFCATYICSASNKSCDWVCVWMHKERERISLLISAKVEKNKKRRNCLDMLKAYHLNAMQTKLLYDGLQQQQITR